MLAAASDADERGVSFPWPTSCAATESQGEKTIKLFPGVLEHSNDFSAAHCSHALLAGEDIFR